MERKRVYLCLAHMSGKEMDYIKEAFDTNWVVPLGPNVNGFEKDLETLSVRISVSWLSVRVRQPSTFLLLPVAWALATR